VRGALLTFRPFSMVYDPLKAVPHILCSSYSAPASKAFTKQASTCNDVAGSFARPGLCIQRRCRMTAERLYRNDVAERRCRNDVAERRCRKFCTPGLANSDVAGSLQNDVATTMLQEVCKNDVAGSSIPLAS